MTLPDLTEVEVPFPEPTHERIALVVDHVARVQGWTADQLHGPLDVRHGQRMYGEDRKLVWARHVAAWVLRHLWPKHPDTSFVRIGLLLGGRTHAAILVGAGRVQKQYDTDADMGSMLDGLIEECRTVVWNAAHTDVVGD